MVTGGIIRFLTTRIRRTFFGLLGLKYNFLNRIRTAEMILSIPVIDFCNVLTFARYKCKI